MSSSGWHPQQRNLLQVSFVSLQVSAQCPLASRSHLAPASSEFAYPKQLFLEFIKEHNGERPFCIS